MAHIKRFLCSSTGRSSQEIFRQDESFTSNFMNKRSKPKSVWLSVCVPDTMQAMHLKSRPLASPGFACEYPSILYRAREGNGRMLKILSGHAYPSIVFCLAG